MSSMDDIRIITRNKPLVLKPESSRSPIDNLRMPFGWGWPETIYYDVPYFDGLWRVPAKFIYDGEIAKEYQFDTLDQACEFYESSSGHCLNH